MTPVNWFDTKDHVKVMNLLKLFFFLMTRLLPVTSQEKMIDMFDLSNNLLLSNNYHPFNEWLIFYHKVIEFNLFINCNLLIPICL